MGEKGGSALMGAKAVDEGMHVQWLALRFRKSGGEHLGIFRVDIKPLIRPSRGGQAQGAGTWNSRYDVPRVLAAQPSCACTHADRSLWVEVRALPAGSVAGLPPIVPGA